MKNPIPSFIKLSVIPAIALSVYACAPSAEEYSKEKRAEYISSALQDSIAAPALGSDKTDVSMPEQIFIRTADLRFSVKDVRRSTEVIEDIVRKSNGFITYSGMSGTRTEYGCTRVEKDSALKLTGLSVNTDITLRVPNENLDSVLIQIAKQADFIESRVISADDVKLQLIASKLAAKRNEQQAARLNKVIDKHGKKLTQTVEAIENEMNAEARKDAEIIHFMSMNDQVNYSTVKIHLYQPERREQTKVFFAQNPEPYTPSFTDKLKNASATGLFIFEGICVFLVTIWPFALIGLSVWLLVRKVMKKKISPAA